MKLSKLKLLNFRRHSSVSIPFEIDTTVLIGENDSGKTSVIEAIRLMLSDGTVVADDFGDPDKPLEIHLEFDSQKSFVMTGILDEGRLQVSKSVQYDARYVASLKENLDSASEEQIKSLCKQFGQAIGSSKPDTLKSKLKSIFEDRDRFKDGKFFVAVNKFGETSRIYFLDGKSFEDVNKFVHETFFKDLQKSIWDEPIEKEHASVSLYQHIDNKVTKIREQIESDLESHDIANKLKKYITDISGIKLRADFERRDISLNIKVMFLVGEVEREVKRFGDGTRRRVTLALLQHKVETESEEALYVLDEPDTHLHPKAQAELLDIIDDIAAQGNQIIVSTHSPFIMNSAYVRQIRLLEKLEHSTKVKRLADEKARSHSIRSLGIENSHLFFSKKLVIVEGKTEMHFFPAAYEKMYGRPMSRDFIRLIPREGIKDAARFTEVVQDFMGHSDVFLITDNDATDEVREIIEGLNIPSANQYRLGIKEFEDAFGSLVIQQAWEDFLRQQNKRTGPDWDAEKIFSLLQETANLSGRAKFSERLSELNKGASLGISKPLLGEALGRFCEERHLPEKVLDFLRHIGRNT